MRPPSSLRKPHVSDTTPNRAFLRGFPATHFLDFGLCRRSRILVAILALCLCIQKFRSRQPGFERESWTALHPQFRRSGRCNLDLGPARQLFWIEAECVELPAPFSRRVAEPFDTNAAG